MNTSINFLKLVINTFKISINKLNNYYILMIFTLNITFGLDDFVNDLTL